MSEADIYNQLNEIFCDLFMIDDINLTKESSAKDFQEWDSMKHIEIIMAIEEKFSVSFSTKELDTLQTVGDLANLIQSKLCVGAT